MTYQQHLNGSLQRDDIMAKMEENNGRPDSINCQAAQERNLLLSKLSLVGEMSSCIAHEVRNPMTTVRGLAQLLAMEHPEKSGYYELMIEEIDHANEVLKEFLCLAKNSPITLKRVMLNDVLRRAVDLLYSQVLQQDLHLYISLSDDVCLYADEGKLIQVFMHLIKNAIEASPKGGNIFVLSRCGAHHAKVRIIDEGSGIKDSLAERIMEPFFTTKEGNPGLGLSVAYKIVEDHSGILKVDSLPGKGTIAEVSLPLVVAEVEVELATGSA